MKVGTKVFALGLLTLILTWWFSGCSKQEPAPTAKIDTRSPEVEKGDEHANHAEANSGGHHGDEHGDHDDHKHHAHKSGEHEHHAHGEHHHKETAPQQRDVRFATKCRILRCELSTAKL